jgi:hypothetical protein
MNNSYPHEWEYFLAMEADLERCSRFVEFSTKNYSTYSIEFARLLLSAGSEIDVLAKVVCDLIAPGNTADRIDHYRGYVTGDNPKFAGVEVIIPRFQLSFHPWQEWASGRNPPWWRAYNGVKHERNVNFEQANLENVLSAFAGYYQMLLFLLFKKQPVQTYDMDRMPRLFQLVPEPSDWEEMSIAWRINFPH